MSGPPPRPWPAHADGLEAVLAEAFRLLSRGVADRRSAFHTPTVATIGPDGVPALRTMVLRGFEASTRMLRLHTDQRAAKFGELAADPRMAIHIYDPSAQMQLRLSGVATKHAANAIAVAAWAASQPGARRCYAATVAPGAAVAAPPPPPPDGDGYANFAVLACEFDRLEWLWLAAAGHRRARFIWAEGGGRDATWLGP